MSTILIFFINVTYKKSINFGLIIYFFKQHNFFNLNNNNNNNKKQAWAEPKRRMDPTIQPMHAWAAQAGPACGRILFTWACVVQAQQPRSTLSSHSVKFYFAKKYYILEFEVHLSFTVNETCSRSILKRNRLYPKSLKFDNLYFSQYTAKKFI